MRVAGRRVCEAVRMELRRVAPVIGLVLLLAADLVLIGWAFRPAPADDYVPAAAATSSSAGSTPKPSPTATGKFTPPKPAPIEQYITAVGPTIAWVAQAGSCANPDGVWVTDDRGTTWTRNALPGRTLRLLAESSTKAQAVGADDNAKCALRLWQTIDTGGDWGKGGDASKAWTRDPNDPQVVHTANDVHVRPCGGRDVIDLSVLDGKRASVLCANGDVRGTTDGGQGWPKSFNAKGALALSVAEGGSGVVVRADAGCRGVVAVPISSGQPAKDGQCVLATPIQGRVSVSNATDGWWLLAGGQVFTADEPIGPWNPTPRSASG